MNLPWKKKAAAHADIAAGGAVPAAAAEKHAFLLDTIADMLALMRTIPLDSDDINAAGFNKGMDELLQVVRDAEDPAPIRTLWKQQAYAIAEFIKRQKEYIRERESEFQTIIEMLSKVVFDNRSFTSHILEKTRKMDRLADLDDIKQLKAALKNEISNMQKDIIGRQNQDDEQLESLKEQIKYLNAELQNATQDSYRDFLTGAFNRQAFEKYLSNIANEVSVSGRTLAMLLVDIDNLKNILLRYGQTIADRVILATAEECRKLMRSEDFLSHCAPGTFVMLLPDENLFNACGMARNLCSVIARSRYAVDKSPKAPRLKFTVSIGVSQLNTGDTIFSFTERAIEALYSAKRAGKNRVMPGKVQAVWSKFNAFKSAGKTRDTADLNHGL